MADDLVVNPGSKGNDPVEIPESDLEWSASRSSGPGGQHVNKSSTRVDLRFDLEGTEALSDEVKARLRKIAKGRFDADGRLVIFSQDTRSQTRNLEEARTRLAELIEKALKPPPPPRKKKKVSRAAKRRRLESKRKHSQKKRNRAKPTADD